MTDTVLDARNLRAQFPTEDGIVKAVDGVSFRVKRGQTLGIVGESGSGKSVTALTIMGLIPATAGRNLQGELWFQGDRAAAPVNLLQLPEQERRRYRGQQMAMIFQEPLSSLNPVYTCGFQITEALRQHQAISSAEARRRAIALLQEVKLLPGDAALRQQCLDLWFHQAGRGSRSPNERELQRLVNRQKQTILNRYPHELSGGQIQRVMIAIAISCNPTLLIADEPTTALDVTVQARILDLLRELRDRRGMAMVFITHDLGLIAEIADTVAVMYQGKIVESGSVLDIFSNPQHPYTKGLLACRPRLDQRLRLLPTIGDFMEVVTTPAGSPEIREKPDSNQRLDQLRAAALSATDWHHRLNTLQERSPLLSIRNLQVGFPVRGPLGRTQRYTMAVNGISFDLYPGETLGLVGESGCGKTTLARTLLQLIKPLHGQVWFDGREITTLPGKVLRQLRRDMQIIFQDPFSSLNPRMTLGAAVMEPLEIHCPQQTRQQRRERAAYLLERVDLSPEWMHRYPHEFSGGQRQRICIARALALNPRFIVCDESVSALDVSVQAQVLNLLKELQEELGLTYIFISHDLSVVKFMSDRILVMNRGKIEELGPAEQVYREPEQAYTRQLIDAIPTGSLARIQALQRVRTAVTRPSGAQSLPRSAD